MTNGPGTTNYYHPFSFEYASYDNDGNMTQFAIPYTGSNMFFRSRYSSTWSSWSKVWNSGNDGSGSGLDADTLDSYQLNTGRANVANRVVATDADGYIQAGWINTTSGANTTQAISRVYASQDGYIRYYSLASFGDQIASHINYNSLENKPTIPAQVSLTGSGATTISGTYPNFTINSTDNNTNTTNFNIQAETGATDNNTNTTNFNIQAESGAAENISAGETVKFTASGSAAVSRTGNTIDISATNTNTTYSAGTGISLSGTTFSNSAPDQTVSLTGAGATTISGTYPNFTITSTDNNTDTNTWVANAAGVAGYVAIPVANRVWRTDSTGTPAWRDDAVGTSGVTTIQVGTNVNAISVSGGTTATATLSAHSTLEAIADGVSVSNLDVDLLKADTIIANKITANTITMNKLQTAPVTGQGTVAIGTAGIRILDSSGNLRIAIGNLTRLATSHNNA
jgi:hypothetical protein